MTGRLSPVAGCLVSLLACSKPSAPVPSDAAPPVATTIPDASPINVTPLPTASIAAMVNPQHLPAYAGETGSVEGTITVTGPAAADTPADFSRCPSGASVYGKAFREGAAETPGGPRPLADAVVAITGYGNYFVQEKDEAETVTIQGCAFSTRTVTMTFGQRLEVKNLTRDFWTPILEPASTSVMMMASPGSDPVKIYPKRFGYHHLTDHDRKYAVSDLYVFLHPLHTSTSVEGKYRIDGIPIGKVKVNTSHPRIPEAESAADVEIKANVVLHVDLDLVNKPPPDAGAPKADAGVFNPRLH